MYRGGPVFFSLKVVVFAIIVTLAALLYHALADARKRPCVGPSKQPTNRPARITWPRAAQLAIQGIAGNEAGNAPGEGPGGTTGDFGAVRRWHDISIALILYV